MKIIHCSILLVFLSFAMTMYLRVSIVQGAEDSLPVGVIARYDDHGAGIPLDTALKMGVKAISIKAPYPENRTHRDAQIILEKVRQAGVIITSMQSGFTGESYKTIPIVRETVGLVPKETRAERMEQFKGVCDFARMLALDVVCFHIGFVPHDPNDPDYKEIIEVTRIACDYAKSKGQRIHLETGQEPGDVLLKFLEDVHRDNLFVNFDPANMILYGCGEPIEALKIVGKYVKSCHCKDAKWSDKPGEEWGEEVPFGQGDVNAKLFMQTLREVGFCGALIIERENRNDPDRQRDEAKAGAELVEQLKAEVFSQ